MTAEPDPRRAAGWVVACFAVSVVAALGLAVVWWRHGSTQPAGLLLAISLATLSAGLATWANRIAPQGPFSEQRPSLVGPTAPEAETGPAPEALAEATTETAPEARPEGRPEAADVSHLPRRALVVSTLAGAVVALGGALLVPFGSLGPRPRDALHRTGWARGRHAVDAEGAVVAAADVPVGGTVTVFPEGYEDAADGQVALVRVDPARLDLPDERQGWDADGLVGYSTVCTHAGCPVGLYLSDTQELLCPCHQSAFDVLRAARPTNGPAAWPLPQLPLSVDENGLVVSEGALSDPVGPGWWKADGS